MSLKENVLAFLDIQFADGIDFAPENNRDRYTHLSGMKFMECIKATVIIYVSQQLFTNLFAKLGHSLMPIEICFTSKLDLLSTEFFSTSIR